MNTTTTTLRTLFLSLLSVLAWAAQVLGAAPAPAPPGPASAAGQELAVAVDLETLLARAAAAAGRPAWERLPRGLHLSGTTDAGGVRADVDLHFAADGRYSFATDGRLAQRWTFDGEDLFLRLRDGPNLRSDLGARESSHLAQWVHSGAWLAPETPLDITLVDGDTADGSVTVAIAFPGSRAEARLVLDAQTWRPTLMRQTILGQETTLSFEDHREVLGVSLAHRLVNVSAGVTTEVVVRGGEAVSAGAEDPFTVGSGPPADAHFDPGSPAETEVRFAPTGHLLVHPRVDGRDVGWFLLDSGAGQICIDPDVADELELERFGELPAVGVAGTVQAAFRPAGSLELGPLTIADPVFVEIELSFLDPIFGVEVAGICGYQVFGRSVLELDLEEPMLALHDPEVYELDDGDWSPLLLDNRTPCIPGRFEGGHEGYFKLDLGDAGTISFYSPAVERLGLLEGRELRDDVVGGVGGAGAAKAGELRWFEVGGQRFEPLDVTFSQVDEGVFSDAHALGNMGTSMLQPFRVVFDYAHGRIALVPRG